MIKTEKQHATAQTALGSRRMVAAMLGVSVKTVYRLEKAGRLTPIKLNSRNTRYHLNEVETLITEATIKPLEGAQ